MNIDDLAYELRNLDPIGRERLFDRLTEAEALDLFQVACWWKFDEAEGSLEIIADLESDNADLREDVDTLKDDIASLEDQLAGLKETAHA